MKIIFLDIDGVLNSRDYDGRRDWGKQTNVDESRLPLLKEIVDATGAKIVLSSTWREHWGSNNADCDSAGLYINNVFSKYGLRIYDKTPYMGLNVPRRDEIIKWLNDTKSYVDSFVILDDCPYDWDNLSDNFVKTNPNFGLGLEKEHVRKAIAILNK